jgi:hypothetical protein
MSNHGTLLKITPTKKLMIEIDQTTYERLNKSMKSIASTRQLSNPRLATWEYDNNGEAQYRISMKLDKYDIQNLRKFEALLGSAVGFTGAFKPYDFVPPGETKKLCGVNYELTSIYKRKVQPTKMEQIEKQMAEVEKQEAEEE